MKPTTVGLLTLAVIVTILSTLNTHDVSLNLIFWSPQISLIILVYSLLIIGFMTGYVVKGMSAYRRAKKSGNKKNETEE